MKIFWQLMPWNNMSHRSILQAWKLAQPNIPEIPKMAWKWVTSSISWNFVSLALTHFRLSCSDPLIQFHFMLCCSFMAINIFSFSFWFHQKSGFTWFRYVAWQRTWISSEVRLLPDFRYIAWQRTWISSEVRLLPDFRYVAWQHTWISSEVQLLPDFRYVAWQRTWNQVKTWKFSSCVIYVLGHNRSMVTDDAWSPKIDRSSPDIVLTSYM